MKVLLCEDIEKLGFLGDIVVVADGYARNYLIAQRLAIVPNEANVRSLAEEKVRRAEERSLVRTQLERAAEAVEGAEAVITAKANEQGHLFGSVAAREIATNLREQGFDISDDMIKLPEHIKEVGTHEVSLKLATDLTATVKVVVVAEGDELKNPEAEQKAPADGDSDEDQKQPKNE